MTTSQFQLPSMATSSPNGERGRKSESEWRKVKHIIHGLYIIGGLTLTELMLVMRKEYKFDATKSQYTTKFKTWKLHKTTKRQIWSRIGHCLKSKRLTITNARVLFNGERIPILKLKKELPRYTEECVDVNENGECNCVSVTVPEGIEIEPFQGANRALTMAIPPVRNLRIYLPWHESVDKWFSEPGFVSFSSQEWSNHFFNAPERPPLKAISDGGFPAVSEPLWSDPIGILTSSHSIYMSQSPLNPFSEQDVVEVLCPRQSGSKLDPSMMHKYLEPYVVERSFNETKEAINELLNPKSTTSMQILSSYIAFFLSNNLLDRTAIDTFVKRVKEKGHFQSLHFIFMMKTASAKAIATQLLHAAVRLDAAELISAALKYGADVESPLTGQLRCNYTLLSNALRHGHRQIAEILLDAGACVNRLTCWNEDDICLVCKSEVCAWPLACAANSQRSTVLIPKLLTRGATAMGCNILLMAITNYASPEVVRCLLAQGEDPSQEDGSHISGHTPLCVASLKLNLEIATILLENGANPNGCLRHNNREWFAGRRFKGCSSPLMCVLGYRASFHGSLLERFVELLLRYGADPNLSPLECFDDNERSAILNYYLDEDTSSPSTRIYPLQEASTYSKSMVQNLLNAGAILNPTFGTPPLSVATRFGKMDIAKWLLRSGSDPNGIGVDVVYHSALGYAVLRNDRDMLQLLVLNGADLNKLPKVVVGQTPLQLAARSGRMELFEHLLDLGAQMTTEITFDHGGSILQELVENGSEKHVLRALNLGADPNQCSKRGRTPLVAAVALGRLPVVCFLIGARADVHVYGLDEDEFEDNDESEDEDDLRSSTDLLSLELPPNKSKLSPIQWAALRGNVEIARILCEAGADVNQQPFNSQGTSALHLAVGYKKTEMTKFLCDKGADVNAYSNGRTPLSFAVAEGNLDMIEYLLKNGADINKLAKLPSCRLVEIACSTGEINVVNALLRAGVNPSFGIPLQCLYSNKSDWENFWGESGSCLAVTELLFTSGADINQRFAHVHTPLQVAILRKHFDCAYYLLEKGAHVNALPSNGMSGRSALQAAVNVGNVDMVEYLLSKEADINAPAAAKKGVTALQAAAISGYLRIAQILLERGADIDAPGSALGGMTALDGAAQFGRFDMVKLLLDNYQGSTPITKLIENAYISARKGRQWFVMELLTTYRPPEGANMGINDFTGIIYS